MLGPADLSTWSTAGMIDFLYIVCLLCKQNFDSGLLKRQGVRMAAQIKARVIGVCLKWQCCDIISFVLLLHLIIQTLVLWGPLFQSPFLHTGTLEAGL